MLSYHLFFRLLPAPCSLAWSVYQHQTPTGCIGSGTKTKRVGSLVTGYLRPVTELHGVTSGRTHRYKCVCVRVCTRVCVWGGGGRGCVRTCVCVYTSVCACVSSCVRVLVYVRINFITVVTEGSVD